MPKPEWPGVLKNPCHNTETNTDCLRWRGGCQVDCPEWTEYIKKRDKNYERRKAQNEIDNLLYGSVSKRSAEKLKYRMRMGRIRK